jgi:hypothetical protein
MSTLRNIKNVHYDMCPTVTAIYILETFAHRPLCRTSVPGHRRVGQQSGGSANQDEGQRAFTVLIARRGLRVGKEMWQKKWRCQTI